MENIKDFTIATVFILICAGALLYFTIGLPAYNGQTSILITENPKFNQTAFNLSSDLGGYQDAQNLDINISTLDEPQESAQGIFLVTETSTSRNVLSRLSGSFKELTSLLGGVFGLTGTQFTWISGALLSLFGAVLLYYIIRTIRIGY